MTLVAFVDHECPYSAKADRTLRVLQATYGDRLRLVVASRPLPMHASARGAARAFLAAHEQGQGEAMRGRLFADRGALDEAGLLETARALRLDLRAFDESRNSRRIDDALARAEALATRVDASGTPTLFINGRRVVGARPLEEVRAVIEEEVVRAAALVARGIAPLRVYDELMSAAPSFVRRPPPSDDRVHEVTLADAPTRGEASAPVTIVVFSDFECP